MKILHVTPSYKPAWVYGGPIFSSAELCEGLVEAGHEVVVYTTTANGEAELNVDTQNVNDVGGVNVYYFKRWTKDHTHFSPALIWKLFKTCKSFDAVHIHSWWNTVAVLAAFVCKLRGTTPVISPRGMLSEYSFGRSKTSLKTLFHSLIGKPVLRKSKVHVTSGAEAKEVGLPCERVFNIHNIVQLLEPVPKQKTEKFKIGFMSRIDPKKNLELLLKSLATADFDYELAIAGSGEAVYLDDLKQLARSLGLENRVQWLERLEASEKFQFLNSLDLFVLLSHNENFANVVVESLAAGTPVLLSDKVGLADFVTAKNLGWVSTTDNAQDVGKTLKNIFYDDAQRLKIENKAAAVVRNKFSRAALIPEYVQMYRC